MASHLPTELLMYIIDYIIPIQQVLFDLQETCAERRKKQSRRAAHQQPQQSNNSRHKHARKAQKIARRRLYRKLHDMALKAFGALDASIFDAAHASAKTIVAMSQTCATWRDFLTNEKQSQYVKLLWIGLGHLVAQVTMSLRFDFEPWFRENSTTAEKRQFVYTCHRRCDVLVALRDLPSFKVLSLYGQFYHEIYKSYTNTSTRIMHKLNWNVEHIKQLRSPRSLSLLFQLLISTIDFAYSRTIWIDSNAWREEECQLLQTAVRTYFPPLLHSLPSLSIRVGILKQPLYEFLIKEQCRTTIVVMIVDMLRTELDTRREQEKALARSFFLSKDTLTQALGNYDLLMSLLAFNDGAIVLPFDDYRDLVFSALQSLTSQCTSIFCGNTSRRTFELTLQALTNTFGRHILTELTSDGVNLLEYFCCLGGRSGQPNRRFCHDSKRTSKKRAAYIHSFPQPKNRYFYSARIVLIDQFFSFLQSQSFDFERFMWTKEGASNVFVTAAEESDALCLERLLALDLSPHSKVKALTQCVKTFEGDSCVINLAIGNAADLMYEENETGPALSRSLSSMLQYLKTNMQPHDEYYAFLKEFKIIECLKSALEDGKFKKNRQEEIGAEALLQQLPSQDSTQR